MMQLEPGMRVRCIRAYAAVGNLEHGAEYTVEKSAEGFVRLAEDDFYLWRVDRFKPVVRVKAPTREVLNDGCCHRTVLAHCRGCPFA